MGRRGSAAVAAAAGGVVVILIGGPEEGRDGEIHLTGVAGIVGQAGDGKAGERGDGRGPAVPGGAAPAPATAAIPVVTTTHNEVPPIRFMGDDCPPQPSIRGGGAAGAKKKKARQPELSRFWQREKDSNPHIQSQSLLCYPYTIPLFVCRSRERRCYYSKLQRNVKRKNEKIKNCGPDIPAHEKGVNDGWDHRSYPGAAPASCSGDACSPGERDSGFWTSSARYAGSAWCSPRFHRS